MLPDKRSVWDWIKYNIRAHAIFHSKYKTKERNERERQLQNNYEEATKIFESDPTKLNAIRLNEIKEKLELFYEEKTKGIIIRARARWHEHGERSSKYFLNLEKRNHVKKHIRKLLVGGSMASDPLTILSEQKRFYQDLYRTKTEAVEINGSINEFLNKLGISKLSAEQKQMCEGKISIQECENVLDSFQTNKSPGNDGIPIEFYKR